MIVQVIVWALTAVGCLVVGRLVGRKWFGLKKDVSGLKRSAQVLSQMMHERGLRRIPAMLDELVVGDIDDLLQSMRDFALMVRDSDALTKELDGAFERSLGVKLGSPEGRMALKIKLEAAEKIALELAKAAAPIAAAAAVAAVPASAPVVIPAAIVASAL